MLIRYVSNWYAPVLVYFNFISSTNVRFKNGKKVFLRKTSYAEFREELFREYLEDKGFSYLVENGKTIVKTLNGLKLIITSDYSNVIDEVFVRNRYGRYDLAGRIVIDVGASIGDTPLYFASIGASKVYAFEVDESRFEIAKENIHLNGMDNIIKMVHTEANSKKISGIIKKKQLSNIFLKLDCEGCEYEIISNISEDTYRQINDIAMEYHKNSDPIVKKLKEAGYDVTREKKVMIPEGHIFASKSKLKESVKQVG